MGSSNQTVSGHTLQAVQYPAPVWFGSISSRTELSLTIISVHSDATRGYGVLPDAVTEANLYFSLGFD